MDADAMRPTRHGPFPAPRIVIAPPSAVYLAPWADVYFYNSGGTDLFFHAGAWWMTWEGRWYQAASWDGPWMYVAPGYLPRAFVRMPSHWRSQYKAWHRVPWNGRHAWQHNPNRGWHRPAVMHKAPKPARRVEVDRPGKNRRGTVTRPNAPQRQDRKGTVTRPDSPRRQNPAPARQDRRSDRRTPTARR
jgi:hypothetical protein